MAAVASLVVFAATPAPTPPRRSRHPPRRAPFGGARATRSRGRAIERKIADELSPEVLVVNDDSEKHATHKGLHDGHAGVRSNESHFSVTVVAEAFAGMTPIKRHRMVNAILQKEFDDGLHALQLSTKTPAEWARPTRNERANSHGRPTTRAHVKTRDARVPILVCVSRLERNPSANAVPSSPPAARPRWAPDAHPPIPPSNPRTR